MMKTSFFSWGINFILRGSIGVVAIYFINEYLEFQGIMVQVGLNVVTFLTSGTLGIPGVAMLYGIMLYQNL